MHVTLHFRSSVLVDPCSVRRLLCTSPGVVVCPPRVQLRADDRGMALHKKLGFNQLQSAPASFSCRQACTSSSSSSNVTGSLTPQSLLVACSSSCCLLDTFMKCEIELHSRPLVVATKFAGCPCRHMHRSSIISQSTAAAAKPNAATQQPLPPDVLHIEQSHGHWHNGVHYVVVEVRDYELDQFQVVNNATYASYVQHGRHKALASLGMPVEQFQQQGTLMALSELSLSYKAPLRAGDTFYVTTAIAQVSAARLVLDHTVQQVTGHQGAQDKPVVACQATATVVFLDQSYKPVRVPASVKQKFAELTAEYKAQKQ